MFLPLLGMRFYGPKTHRESVEGVQLVPLILTPSSPVCLLVRLLEAASR